MKIIMISGKAESGKTTLANFIKEKLSNRGYRCCVINMADYLKFICKSYLGWDGEKDDEGRTLLQEEGTDYLRALNPSYHCEATDMVIVPYQTRFDFFIIGDWRFVGEYEYFNSRYDVEDIRIIREGHENSLTQEQRNHPSEVDLDGFAVKHTLRADSGEDNVSLLADCFIETLLGKE